MPPSLRPLELSETEHLPLHRGPDVTSRSGGLRSMRVARGGLSKTATELAKLRSFAKFWGGARRAAGRDNYNAFSVGTLAAFP
jgi:hypothetical protein